jgi:hypothetical protein
MSDPEESVAVLEPVNAVNVRRQELRRLAADTAKCHRDNTAEKARFAVTVTPQLQNPGRRPPRVQPIFGATHPAFRIAVNRERPTRPSDPR